MRAIRELIEEFTDPRTPRYDTRLDTRLALSAAVSGLHRYHRANFLGEEPVDYPVDKLAALSRADQLRAVEYVDEVRRSWLPIDQL